MKKTLLVIAVLLLAVHFTYAQDILVNGKTFQTVKKTVLNAETGYYQLKEKGKRTAKQESYVKTGGRFHKTVFTETELKNFFRTGSISSLGKVEETKVSDKLNVRHLTKDSKKVFLSRKNNELLVYEYTGNLNDLVQTAKLNNDNDGPSPERLDCGEGCLARDRDCREEFGPQEEYPDNDVCFDDFIACVARCDEAFGRKGSNLTKYTFTMMAVKITK